MSIRFIVKILKNVYKNFLDEISNVPEVEKISDQPRWKEKNLHIKLHFIDEASILDARIEHIRRSENLDIVWSSFGFFHH